MRVLRRHEASKRETGPILGFKGGLSFSRFCEEIEQGGGRSGIRGKEMGIACPRRGYWPQEGGLHSRKLDSRIKHFRGL